MNVFYRVGQLMLYADLPYAGKLRRELGAHHREVRERQTIARKEGQDQGCHRPIP